MLYREVGAAGGDAGGAADESLGEKLGSECNGVLLMVSPAMTRSVASSFFYFTSVVLVRTWPIDTVQRSASRIKKQLIIFDNDDLKF